jgi:hypothetical protein
MVTAELSRLELMKLQRQQEEQDYLFGGRLSPLHETETMDFLNEFSPKCSRSERSERSTTEYLLNGSNSGSDSKSHNSEEEKPAPSAVVAALTQAQDDGTIDSNFFDESSTADKGKFRVHNAR